MRRGKKIDYLELAAKAAKKRKLPIPSEIIQLSVLKVGYERMLSGGSAGNRFFIRDVLKVARRIYGMTKSHLR